MKCHWISPYDRAKNIGGAINQAIEQLNAADDDFIILTDQDVLFLLPDTKAHIINILETTKYGILGCLTNRLGSTEQLVAGMFNEDSISKHVNCAAAQWRICGPAIYPAEIVAAMLMCFKVSTWRALGGFDENRINFDWLFCTRAPKKGLKVGIMAGIYILHLYRYGSKDPVNDYKHLEL